MSASRRAFWVRSGLLALAVFALLGFTLHSLRLSDASFTTASANASNVFIAGSLGHVNNRSGQIVVAGVSMEPGDVTIPATMTLTGTGTVAGDYTLSVANLTNTSHTALLSDELVLTVDDVTGPRTTVWDDTLGNLQAEPDPPDLGTIAPLQTRSYEITLSYPDGPNEGSLQGSSTTVVLQITGVSQ